jgi:hypothetical protein
LFLSQVLIIFSWSDAKFGTIPNLITLVVAIVSLGAFLLQNRFKTIVRADLANNNTLSTEVLTESDIARLLGDLCRCAVQAKTKPEADGRHGFSPTAICVINTSCRSSTPVFC